MDTEIGKSGAPVAGYSGLRDPSVLDELRRQIEEEPFRFFFFQAVRLLQRMDPTRKPVGYFFPPGAEAVRFKSRPSLAFAASDIYDLNGGDAGQPNMTVEFMGLSASLSVLPAVYTEYLLERIRLKDSAMVDFFDIFNHRVVSMFYRAWEKYRFYIAYERAGEDKLSERLFDLLGLGTSGLKDRMQIPDRIALNYLGNLSRQVRSALSLEQLLEEYFEVPVRVRQFIGSWSQLPPQDRTVLTDEGGKNERLGQGAVVGEEVWDQHGRIGVTIGPMGLDRYLEFLPGKEAHRELESWLRFFTNGRCETEVRLVLDRDQVPACVLGAKSDGCPRLGLVSWLRTGPMGRDPGDAIILIQ